MMKRIMLLAITIVLATALLAGCGGGIKESDVGYAGPLVDNLINAIENQDYEAFSADMSDTMKSAMPKENFEALADMISSNIGEYQNKAFAQAAETNENDIPMTVVVYTAKYTEEAGDVLITVAFSGEEGDRKIEGLYFNSPNLKQ